MGNIFIAYDSGVPQIACSDCGKCESIMGKSLCSITGRGCCHYFPEFTLADLHRMAVLDGGAQALDMIVSTPGAVINNYNIYARGFFDKEGYDRYMDSGCLMETGSIRDHTIFFRSCPFVEPGRGCMLPPRFRTTVCNFFLCSEILERRELQNEFKPYIEERMRYSRWSYRESTELMHMLVEHGVNLARDFSGSLELLAGLPLSLYDFPELPEVIF